MRNNTSDLEDEEVPELVPVSIVSNSGDHHSPKELEGPVPVTVLTGYLGNGHPETTTHSFFLDEFGIEVSDSHQVK